MTLRIGGIVLDAQGPKALAQFWPEATGFPVGSASDESAVRWEGDLPFEVPDYTLDLAEQVGMYRTQLAGGIEDPPR